jgi:hypothetical protein
MEGYLYRLGDLYLYQVAKSNGWGSIMKTVSLSYVNRRFIIAQNYLQLLAELEARTDFFPNAANFDGF